jgi:hypothetical protein
LPDRLSLIDLRKCKKRRAQAAAPMLSRQVRAPRSPH